MAKTIGIDLGTTFSVVAVMEGAKPVVIANADGSRTMPSVVAFTDKGERLVGSMARRQAVTNPQNTVYSIKRFMGRRHEEVAAEEKMVPYKIVGEAKQLVKVEVRGKQYTPPEISAMVLQGLKKTAEDYLGEKVEKAVITVPAYFNDAQRQATKEAGLIAGLKVERIINEPTAASLAYGLEKKKQEKIAVFDLGGGTFDVSILEVGEGVFEVLSTNGDTHLGGDDFDQALMNYLAEEFLKQTQIDLRKDLMALQRLKEAAEKAKCDLSGAMQTEVNLPFIAADQSGPKHLQLTLTRAKLEQILAPLFERCRKPCLQALKDAKLNPQDMNEVVLVGGSSRIPKVQALAKEIFGREPNKSVNPDEVVAIGAAIQGAVLAGEVDDVLLLDVTPLSLGVETVGGVMTKLIQRNTTIPTSKKIVCSTAADNQPAVDVTVLQGERQMAKDNRVLGKFQLTGIRLAPRGVPKIEVTFNIDADGILHVSAQDLDTGKKHSVVIKVSSGLSEADVERMRKEAAQYEAQDRQAGELAELRNDADNLLYIAEKTYNEQGSKLDKKERKVIFTAIEQLRKVKDGQDAAAIRAAMDQVNTSAQKLLEAAPQAADEAPEAETQPAEGEQKKDEKA